MTNPNLTDCPSLTTLFTGKFTGLAANTSMRYLKHALLPSLRSISNWPTRGANMTCFDFGYYSGSVNQIASYGPFANNAKWCMIMRAPSVVPLTRSFGSNGGTAIRNSSYGRIFVPASLVSDYQSHDYWGVICNVAAIGGTEWQSYFEDAEHPSSEYANVEVYAPELYDSYYEEYEKAKAASTT